MSLPGIDDREVGAPPLRRALVGLLLGLVTGLLAAASLPRDEKSATDAEPPTRAERTIAAGPR